jgi:hypothetical protein
VSVPAQSPAASSGAVAVVSVAPVDEVSDSFAVVDPNVPPAGHGVTEVTPIADPAGPELGENARDPDGIDEGDSSTTRLLFVSVTYTSPALSTVTPNGELSPLNGSVVCAPPTGSSTTRLPRSPTNTSPDPSTATPDGRLSPANGSACWENVSAPAGAAHAPRAASEHRTARHPTFIAHRPRAGRRHMRARVGGSNLDVLVCISGPSCCDCESRLSAMASLRCVATRLMRA